MAVTSDELLELDTDQYTYSDTVQRTYADALADRASSREASKAVLDVKVKTNKVICVKLVDRPDGCTGKHCETSSDRCIEIKCIERLTTQLSTIDSENEVAAASYQAQLQEIDEILWSISAHCRTDDLYYPTMEESRLALESAKERKTEPASCQCVTCRLSYEQKEAKNLKQKRSAAKTRLTVLREYRRANDKEALERTSSNYMKGGKYFTPVGGAKAKGVKALRPTLQMQSSYDVATLTTNSMEERPLIVSGKGGKLKK